MKRKLIYILISILICATSSSAQDDGSLVKGFKMGIVPSALMNDRMGIQGKVAFGFTDNIEILSNYASLFGKTNGDKYTGYRVRSGIRFYPSTYNEEARFYIELGHLIRHVDLRTEGSFEIDNSQETEAASYNNLSTIKGAYFSLGGVLRLRNRFLADVGLGVGRGSNTVEHQNTPANSKLLPTSSFFFGNNHEQIGSYSYPILIFHLALLYRF